MSRARRFPDWTGEAQVRPFTLDGDRLVLRTPPKVVDGRTTVNEMAWVRASSRGAAGEPGTGAL